MANQNQLLLLEDVEDLGRSGDVVSVKPGYARNFLIPQKKATVASKQTLRMQARLRDERLKQAADDRQNSEKLAEGLKDLIISTEVKVDPEGKMYGSVSALDLSRMLLQKGFEVEKRYFVLPHPIKDLGEHLIQLKLKEGVPASFKLQVITEGSAI